MKRLSLSFCIILLFQIFSSLINLKDQKQLKKLTDYLKKNDLHIGVLDLVNFYFETYLEQEAYHHLLKTLHPFGSKDALLLAMSNYKVYACGQFQIYIGFTFGHIEQWPEKFKIQDFFARIPTEVHDLIIWSFLRGNREAAIFY